MEESSLVVDGLAEPVGRDRFAKVDGLDRLDRLASTASPTKRHGVVADGGVDIFDDFSRHASQEKSQTGFNLDPEDMELSPAFMGFPDKGIVLEWRLLELGQWRPAQSARERSATSTVVQVPGRD